MSEVQPRYFLLAGISPDYRVITSFPGVGDRLCAARLGPPGRGHGPGTGSGLGPEYDTSVSFPGYDMDVS
jgi:hypothetical protein